MIGIAAPNKNVTDWITAFRDEDSSISLSSWPDLSSETELLVCWQPPMEVFEQLSKLKAIYVMGAGLDALLAHPNLPENIPIHRLTNEQLARDMYHHVLHCIESWRLNFTHYRISQHHKRWAPMPYPERASVKVSILGLGHIGSYVCQQLARDQFQVTGWSENPKDIDSATTFHGQDQLLRAVDQADVLVNLLALNKQTRGILNTTVFKRLAESSCVINVARGAHLDEQALLDSFNNPIAHAFLDVFDREPLPNDHAFWAHPQITITPHIASLTNPVTAVKEIIAFYRTLIPNK